MFVFLFPPIEDFRFRIEEVPHVKHGDVHFHSGC